MAIAFSYPPPKFLPTSFVEFDSSNAFLGAGSQPSKILVLGESEKALEGIDPFQPLQILTKEQGEKLFGENSMLTQMVNSVFENSNSTPVFALPIPKKEASDLQKLSKESSQDLGNKPPNETPKEGEGKKESIEPKIPTKASAEIITDIFQNLDDTQYNIIAYPYCDIPSLKALSQALNHRFKPERQIEGHAFCAMKGEGDEIIKAMSELNCPHLSVLAVSSNSETSEWVWASSLASVVSHHAQIDPARPFTTLPLSGIKPTSGRRMKDTERASLLQAGASTYLLTRDGMPVIEQLVTTSQVDAEKFVNTMLIHSFIRYSFRNHFKTKFPRHKLASDQANFGPGQVVLTPKSAKAEAVALFREWEERGIVQNVDAFKSALICELNRDDPTRLDFYLPPQYVSGLTTIAVKVGYLF